MRRTRASKSVQVRQETLRRVEDNDSTLTNLRIGSDFIGIDGAFFSSVGDDFSRLGDYIVENTHLTRLDISLANNIALDVTNDGFYDGLKQNKSINKLDIIGFPIYVMTLTLSLMEWDTKY